MTITLNGMSTTADRVAIAAAAVLSAVSIGLFAWDARPTLVALAWPPRTALAWDAGLSLLFFLQHSTMVRRPFRARLARVLPARYGGLVYAITSGVTLLFVVLLWQRVDVPVYRLEGAAGWVVAALAVFVAALLLISGYAARRTIDFLGVKPVRAHWRRESPPSIPIIVEGPYRWVRHPLYSCILALFWLRPEVMADGLLLSVLWSAWILAATILEERDLVAELGDAYRDYQRRVPMLIPWRGPVR